MIARDRFNRVRFIKNHDVVIRQNAHARTAKRDVAEQERVVHDKNLRVLHSPPIFVVKALAVRRTAPAHAVAAVAGDLVPDLTEWLKRQIAQRSVDRLLAPLSDLPQLGNLLIVVEQALATRE